VTPVLFYHSGNVPSPAYHLRYTWTGWPSVGSFPAEPVESFFKALAEAWETDGIRYMERQWCDQHIQFTCSVKPTVSPTLFTSRVKGRLDHALRSSGKPTVFSRKVAFRSIGDNRREDVEAYIANQVTSGQFLDSKFSELLARYTHINPAVHLDTPTAVTRGRYWYNLHVVLVTEQRQRFVDEASWQRIAETCVRVASEQKHLLGSYSIMPEHLHMALRGNVQQSPEAIALGFMNGIADAFGQQPVLRPGYYVGTFGEYEMRAVRR
jgi:REP element-mobilizing transposase RayT